MNNYRNIKIAFSYFPAFTEESPDMQKRDFCNAAGTEWIDLFSLRREIRLAENDRAFSWIAIAKEKDFIKFEDGMTEDEVYLEFKLLTWEAIFPDEILGETEIQNLQKWLIRNLVTDEFVSLKSLKEKLKAENIFQKEIDDFEFIRAYLYHEGYRKITLKQDIGENERFLKLSTPAVGKLAAQ